MDFLEISKLPSVIVSEKDVNGRYTYVSELVQTLFLKSPEEIIGRTDVELLGEHRAPSIVDKDFYVINSGSPLKCKDTLYSELHSKELVFMTIRTPKRGIDGSTTGVSSIYIDITCDEEERRHLLHAAKTDPLTGCGSRYALTDYTDRMFDNDSAKITTCALMIDLDDFKIINDNYGHTQGDSVLYEIGKELLSLSREGDSVYRYGGDEFIVMMECTTIECAEVQANVILDRLQLIQLPKQLEETGHRPTCSIGVVPLFDCETPNDLLNKVDEALRCAKHNGKHRVISVI